MCRTTTLKPRFAEGEEWLEKFDLSAFTKEIKELGDKLLREQGEDDVRHLRKMVFWCNMCAAIGLLGMGWFKWNIVSIVALSTWTFTRWTMIAHHTCHGGYDKCHPNKGRWNRFKFAVGSFWRRLCDWFDWMMPEAWNVEHNNRHHYKLSEKEDPDLVENNMRSLRKSEMPLPLKYLKLSVLMVTWKWFYYAPNTYKELKMAKMRREGKSLPAGKWDPEDPVTFQEILSGQNPFYSMSEFFAVVAGPYFVIHFLLLPLPYLFIGRYMGLGDTLYLNALVNLFAAELLTNFHAFFAVVTNHAGDDMYRFRKSCRPFSGSFFLRQVLASAAFDMGTDPIDFFHGFLNYQVEHHLWPSLSMLSYQKAAPQVQAICAKHGVPYIKQNVFWRLKKTTDIMVGTANMKWFPLEYENKFLAIDSVAPAGTQLDSKKEE